MAHTLFQHITQYCHFKYPRKVNFEYH